MAIDFPNAPSINDIFIVNDISYIWDGITWDIVSSGSGNLDGGSPSSVYLESQNIDGGSV